MLTTSCSLDHRLNTVHMIEQNSGSTGSKKIIDTILDKQGRKFRLPFHFITAL